MKPIRLALLVSSCAVLASSAAHAAAAPAAPKPVPSGAVQAFTLKNGLRALLMPDPRATAVDVSVWYPAGVRYERVGTRGISHLFERLSSRGATPGGVDEVGRMIAAEGGTTAAYTSADFTCYTHTVPRGALATALRLEAGRMTVRLTQAMLDQERAQVHEELRARGPASPVERGLERLYATAFKTHPYRWPVAGTDEDLDRITLRDCQDFLRARYAPDQALVVIAGDFAADQAAEELRRGFQSIPGRGQAVTVAPEPEPTAERRAVATGDAPVPLLIVGWRLPAGAAADAPALDLISTLLSRGASARLGPKASGGDRPGLFAQTGRDSRRDATMFWAASAARSLADTATVEHWLVGAIETLAAEPVSGEELDRARRQLEVPLLLNRQRARDRGQAAGVSQMIGGDWNDDAHRLERVRTLTPADLQQAAARTLNAARRAVVWMLPAGAGNGGRP